METELDFYITFPCLRGWAENDRGRYDLVHQSGNKKCIPLFSQFSLLDRFYGEICNDAPMDSQASFARYNKVDELAEYFEASWSKLLLRETYHFAMDPLDGNVVVAESIARFLWECDRKRFLEHIWHSPFHHWYEIPASRRDFRSLPRIPRYNLGAFQLGLDETVRLPDGREVRADEHGQLCVFDGEDVIQHAVHQGTTITAWTGSLRFGTRNPPPVFVFEAMDNKSTWAYKYDRSQECWFELMLAGGREVEEDEIRPGYSRCPVCRTWNAQDEFECMMCKALLMVPHCKICGAEVEEETNRCPVCEESDQET